jgi:hypothetical protein
VIIQLLVFTVIMICGPIGTYYLTLNLVFKGLITLRKTNHTSANAVLGNSSYAGALAAMVANVILAVYVIIAFREDQGERSAATQKKTN